MIAWTIYVTFAGAVLLLFLPRVFRAGSRCWRRPLAVSRSAWSRFFQMAIVDLAHFTTIVRVPWVPALGMNYHLAADGISLTLALVTGLTAVSAVLFLLGRRAAA